MSYIELVEARLNLALIEQRRRLFSTFDGSRKRFIENLSFSDSHDVAAVVDLYAESLEGAVRDVIDRLRDEALALTEAEFSELWVAAKQHFDSEVPRHARRYLSSLLSEISRGMDRGKNADLERYLSDRLGLRTSALLQEVQFRIVDCTHSRKLLPPPGRRATQEIVALVEEVSALVRTNGDVAKFVQSSSSRLERIEAEVRRQGMDIEFAADALAESMANKLTTRGGLSQLIGGVSTNAAYDGIKNSLAALLGLVGS